ncbi:anthrone oxygenase family protein [Fibrella forsythiae]|uniref:DUF1772 domain-containing protein n=1 Tax=Fibrella forsythiae TaxID=2817061 RepID=A0ABS3JAM0_9BACT|nr:anthrone oxygenase family protein [Fibrella forsythiae]MBO0947037.1 DUF1772 domain-containing protein [Fibrella forsythiae]
MPSFQTIVLACAALTCALVAGLLFAYACSVNPGLNRLPDTAYVLAMQSINRKIQNPLFFSTFLGTALLLPVAAYMHYQPPLTPRFWLLTAAAATYLVGVIGITVGGNVPLNEALDAFSVDSATAQQIAESRNSFETPWNTLHTIRTVAAVASLLFVICSLLSNSESVDVN